MKKTATFGVVCVALLALASQCLPAVGEYASVFARRAERTVDASIPMSVKIERMEVIKDKLDSQVHRQAENVAEAKIALEDAETQLAASGSRCQQTLSDLATLRNACDKSEVYVSSKSSCGSSKTTRISRTQVLHALEQTAVQWKVHNQTLEARRLALNSQRAAYEKLSNEFNHWRSQKDLLGSRIETLKARHAAQQLSGSADSNSIDGADLTRAEQLADSIDKSLRVSEASNEIVDGTTSDVASTLRDLESDPQSSTSPILAEVDKILKESKRK
jgi:phage shock protein A